VTAEHDVEFRFPPRHTPTGRELGALIADFLADVDSGRVRDSAGRRYSRDSLRELRAALTHVDSELGHLSIEEIGSRDIARLLDDLGRAEVRQERLDSIVVALHRLHGYAGDQGLISGRSTFPDPALPGAAAPEPAAAVPDDRTEPRTPTLELLAATRRVATWTVRSVVFVFAVLVVLFIIEL